MIDWYDKDDHCIIDPLTDSGRWLDRMSLDQAFRASPLVVLASRYHGIFAAVCEALINHHVTITDNREHGYLLTRTETGGQVTTFSAPGSAPWAAQALETLISRGAKVVLFLNGSGSLLRHLGVGTLLLPTELLREEGTSYHYIPACRRLETSQTLRQQIQGTADRLGYKLYAGVHWTTDAIYRETVSKVDRYAAQGVLSVDMELSALAAVAIHRGIQLAALHVVTDILEQGHSWRGADSQQFVIGRRQAAQIAADLFR